MDLASRSARLKASTELMSGLRAPARTSTPMPDRAMSMRLASTIRPSVIQSSTTADPVIRRSNGSPALARRANASGRPLEIMRRVPELRSNSAPTSESTVAIARVVHTVSSLAAPGTGRVSRQTTAATGSRLRLSIKFAVGEANNDPGCVRADQLTDSNRRTLAWSVALQELEQQIGNPLRLLLLDPMAGAIDEVNSGHPGARRLLHPFE